MPRQDTPAQIRAYWVTLHEVWHAAYKVRAASKAEALAMARSGNGVIDTVQSECSHSLDTYDIERAKVEDKENEG